MNYVLRPIEFVLFAFYLLHKGKSKSGWGPLLYVCGALPFPLMLNVFTVLFLISMFKDSRDFDAIIFRAMVVGKQPFFAAWVVISFSLFWRYSEPVRRAAVLDRLGNTPLFANHGRAVATTYLVLSGAACVVAGFAKILTETN